MMWRSRREGSNDEALLAVLGERLRDAAARVTMRPGFQSSLRTSLTMEAALGERLRDAAAQVDVRPGFKSSLRTALTMEAATALVPAPGEQRAQPVRTVRRMPRRRTTIVAAFVAAVLGLGGVTSASASALPGEGLYPIKRAAERVELAFHRGLADRGTFKLELAERRLAEARDLAARGDGDLAAESVREFEEAAADGTRDLMDSYREDNATASMVVLNEFTVRTDEVLDDLASQLPSESSLIVDDARERVEAIGSQSEQLCPTCGGGTNEGLAPSDPDDSVDPAPEPEPEPPAPAEPPSEPSLPVPPVSAPTDTTPTSSQEEEDEDDEESDEEDEEESDETDSDEPETPTPPAPAPTPEPPAPTPEPTPTPTPTPTPEPTEPPVPPIPPVPTDPPTILPPIVPDTIEGVGKGLGQLIGGTLGGLHLGQNKH